MNLREIKIGHSTIFAAKFRKAVGSVYFFQYDWIWKMTKKKAVQFAKDALVNGEFDLDKYSLGRKAPKYITRNNVSSWYSPAYVVTDYKKEDWQRLLDELTGEVRTGKDT